MNPGALFPDVDEFKIPGIESHAGGIDLCRGTVRMADRQHPQVVNLLEVTRRLQRSGTQNGKNHAFLHPNTYSEQDLVRQAITASLADHKQSSVSARLAQDVRGDPKAMAERNRAEGKRDEGEEREKEDDEEDDEVLRAAKQLSLELNSHALTAPKASSLTVTSLEEHKKSQLRNSSALASAPTSDSMAEAVRRIFSSSPDECARTEKMLRYRAPPCHIIIAFVAEAPPFSLFLLSTLLFFSCINLPLHTY